MEDLDFTGFPDAELLSVKQGVFVLASPRSAKLEDDRSFIVSEGFRPLPRYEVAQQDSAPSRRLQLFRASWKNCQRAVENVLGEVNEQTLSDFLSLVRASDSREASNVARYIERTTIPAALLIGGNQTFLAAALQGLNVSGDDNPAEEEGDGSPEFPRVFAIRISGRDCASIPSATRKIVQGFLNAASFPLGELGNVLGARLHLRLALDDLQTLTLWYRKQYGEGRDAPRLAIVVDDVEMSYISVMEDFVQILSRYALKLPLFLVLSVQSSPDALLSVLPRTSLPFLRLTPFWLHPSDELVVKLLHAAFVAPITSFDISSEVFARLLDSYLEDNKSLDSVVSKIHYLHLAFFYQNPTALLALPSTELRPLAKRAISVAALDMRSTKSWRAQVDGSSVSARSSHPPSSTWANAGEATGDQHMNDNSPSETTTFAEEVRRTLSDDSFLVRSAIDHYRRRPEQSRRVCWALRLIGTLASTWPEKSKSSTWLLRGLWNGDLSEYGQELSGLLERSDDSRFASVLSLICEHAPEVAIAPDLQQKWDEFRHYEAETRELVSSGRRGAGRTHLVNTSVPHVGVSLTDNDKMFSQLVSRVAELLRQVFRDAFDRSRWHVFNEAWTVDDTRLIDATFNPRYSGLIKEALRSPSPFLAVNRNQVSIQPEHRRVDTAGAYQLYQDSGKLVNIGDWSGAFDIHCSDDANDDVSDSGNSDTSNSRATVDGKRGASQRLSPASRKRRKTTRGINGDGEHSKDQGPPRRLPKRQQMDARFLRAVSDLGFQGLVTATKRKPEHLNRIIW